jgi:hypothetical protein
MRRIEPPRHQGTKGRTGLACRGFGLWLILAATAGWGQTSNIKSDQTVVFFPSMGRRVAGGKEWELEIHGCVYELDRRTLELAALRGALALDRVKMDADELAIFKARTRLFLADNKGGHVIVVRLGGKDYSLKKSGANGHFTGTLRLSDEEVENLRRAARGNRIEFHAVMPPKDSRAFAGAVDLVDNAGVTVISDIDDTIKITEVRERRAMLRNTFLDGFRAVPRMAEIYRTWAREPGTEFHYVSASPWQLFLPLNDFIRTNGFPAGIFCLKHFRVKDESFFSLFEAPGPYKLRVIEPLLKQFPDRRFVLVGDSGEQDPEAYAALARKYPRQVAHIYIRNVTNEGPASARFQKDFKDLPTGMWQVFTEPGEISKEIRN